MESFYPLGMGLIQQTVILREADPAMTVMGSDVGRMMFLSALNFPASVIISY